MKTNVCEFIVVYNDNDCLCLPLTWDPDVTGGIWCGDVARGVAMFASRAAARQAIRISYLYHELLRLQGLPYNSDFTEAKTRKFFKIVPLVRHPPKHKG